MVDTTWSTATFTWRSRQEQEEEEKEFQDELLTRRRRALEEEEEEENRDLNGTTLDCRRGGPHKDSESFTANFIFILPHECVTDLSFKVTYTGYEGGVHHF